MTRWLGKARPGVIALGVVILVQLALASGYLTALDTIALHRLPVAATGPPPVAVRLFVVMGTLAAARRSRRAGRRDRGHAAGRSP